MSICVAHVQLSICALYVFIVKFQSAISCGAEGNRTPTRDIDNCTILPLVGPTEIKNTLETFQFDYRKQSTFPSLGQIDILESVFRQTTRQT